MVLGIITSIAACPAIIGTTEVVRQGSIRQMREALVSCSDPSRKARDVHGGTLVLRDKVSHICVLHFTI
jgi:hypothetical protein